MISPNTITSFVNVVGFQLGRSGGGQEPPIKVIDCLQEARICLPELDKVSLTLTLACTLFLTCTLFDHFKITYSNDDCEEGIAILDQFLTSHASRDKQYEEALQTIAAFTLL